MNAHEVALAAYEAELLKFRAFMSYQALLRSLS